MLGQSPYLEKDGSPGAVSGGRLFQDIGPAHYLFIYFKYTDLVQYFIFYFEMCFKDNLQVKMDCEQYERDRIGAIQCENKYKKTIKKIK